MDGVSKVVCLLCNKEFKHITPTHLRKHNTSMGEYRIKFPHAELHISRVMQEETKQKLRESRARYLATLSPEERKKKLATRKGVAVPQELRDKISKTLVTLYADMLKSGKRRKTHSAWNKGLTEKDPRVAKCVAHNYKFTYVDKPCRECGKLINVASHKKPKFCSRSCYAVWRKKNHTVNGIPNYVHSGHWSHYPYAEYGKEFTHSLRKQVRDRDSQKCTTLFCTSTSKLVVHHIDCNKCNNSLDNLITLCRLCHARTHFSKTVNPLYHLYQHNPRIVTAMKYCGIGYKEIG